jgi:hypothetical protein
LRDFPGDGAGESVGHRAYIGAEAGEEQSGKF